MSVLSGISRLKDLQAHMRDPIEANKEMSNKTQKLFRAGFFLICLLASVLLCLNRLPLVAAMLCLGAVYAAVSMANTSFLSIYPMGYAQSGNVATVGGIMDFCTYLGAGAASVPYGFIIQNWGYLPMFVSWVVLSVLSLFFLKKLETVHSAGESA